MIGIRGLSPIIAVVLLLMITVVAATLIVSFAIPFVKNNLKESEECFDVLGDLEFAETEYNCYYEDPLGIDNNLTGFSVRVDNADIIGFSIALQYKGNSYSYDIKNETQVAGLKVLLSGTDLVVPKKGETRTYVADGLFTRAEIFPIIKGDKRCDMADELTLQQCTDAGVIGDLKLN